MIKYDLIKFEKLAETGVFTKFLNHHDRNAINWKFI